MQKIKFFFAETFGSGPFYFYIFISSDLLGWDSAVINTSVGLWCFPRGRKFFVTADFAEQGGVAALFFLHLVRGVAYHYNTPLYRSNILILYK